VANTVELYPPVKTTSARELVHIPGSMGLPVLGVSAQLAIDFEGTIRKLYQKYGEISKASIFFNTGVLVNGPENVRRIQLNSNQEFSNWIGYANTVAEWFGNAILFRDLDDHRLQRRIVLTAFSSDAMRNYTTKTNEIVASTIHDWDKQENFITLPHLRQMLIHIAAKIFYGIDDLSVGAKALGESFTAMLNGMETLIKVDCWPFKYSRGVKGKKLVREYLRSLMPQRSDGSGNDLMSFMVRASLDDQPPTLTEEELIDHLSLLFFAGYDTTTTTLLHMLMHLGRDQKLQEQLREESRALGKAQPDYDDLEKLKGIHHAFQETLRLYPATPFTLRGTAKECELGGYRIPANTLLFIPSIVNHTLPEYWNNPLEFDPGRFAPGREEHKRNNGAHYYPFGGGAHKCVGMHFAAMNAKVFMHQLLLKYRFKTPDNYAPRMIKLPMPRPADNLPLSFERIA
jgi:cytochrome P450